MNNRIRSFISLAMLAAFVDQAHAQSPPAPDAIKTIGSCVAIQTNVMTVETPLGLRAEGSCEASQGDTRGCTKRTKQARRFSAGSS